MLCGSHYGQALTLKGVNSGATKYSVVLNLVPENHGAARAVAPGQSLGGVMASPSPPGNVGPTGEKEPTRRALAPGVSSGVRRTHRAYSVSAAFSLMRKKKDTSMSIGMIHNSFTDVGM